MALLRQLEAVHGVSIHHECLGGSPVAAHHDEDALRAELLVHVGHKDPLQPTVQRLQQRKMYSIIRFALQDLHHGKKVLRQDEVPKEVSAGQPCC